MNYKYNLFFIVSIILIITLFFVIYKNNIIEGMTQAEYEERNKEVCTNDIYKIYNDNPRNCTIPGNIKYPYCDLKTYNILRDPKNKYPVSHITDWLKQCFNDKVTGPSLKDGKGVVVTESYKNVFSCTNSDSDKYPVCTKNDIRKEIPDILSLVDRDKTKPMIHFTPYINKDTNKCCGGWSIMEDEKATPEWKNINTENKKVEEKGEDYMGGTTPSLQKKCQQYNDINKCNNDNECEYVDEPGIEGNLTTIGCQSKTFVSFMKKKLRDFTKTGKVKASETVSSFRENDEPNPTSYRTTTGDLGKPGLTKEQIYLQHLIGRQIPSANDIENGEGHMNSVSVGNGNNTIGTELKILLNPWLRSSLKKMQPESHDDLIRKTMVSIEQQLLEGRFMNEPGAPQPANYWVSCLQDNPNHNRSIILN